jgi:hypothetical protein
MIPPNPFILARLYGELWLGLGRALMTPWTRYPTGIYPPARDPERKPAMDAPIERASDWDGDERGGEVIEFRRNGGL